MNAPSIPTRVQDEIMGVASSVKGFFADFLTPIIPKINREPKI